MYMIRVKKIRHIIIIYFLNVYFFHAQLGLDAQLGLNICPDMKPLHISLNSEHYLFRLQAELFISSFTLELWTGLNFSAHSNAQPSSL